MEGYPKLNREKDHKANNIHYRRAILAAIEQLNDSHLRSPVDAIRKYVQSSIMDFKDTVFMQTLKAVVQDGEVEQCTTLNIALSPQFKRKRANSLSAILEKKGVNSNRNSSNHGAGIVVPPLMPIFTKSLSVPSIPQQQPQSPTPAHVTLDCQHFTFPLKSPPKRKAEHEKWKIMPKKLHDKTLIVNPMDTH